MTRDQLRALEPPPAWDWVRRPTLRTSGSVTCPSIVRDQEPRDIEQHLKALHDWALQNNLGLSGPAEQGTRGAASIRWYNRAIGSTGYVYRSYTVKANAPERTKVRVGTNKTDCCGERVPSSRLFCENCYGPITCGECGFTGHLLHEVNVGRQVRKLCANCSKPCATKKCSTRIRKADTAKKCNECEPIAWCEWCDKSVPAAQAQLVEPEQRTSGGRVHRRAKYMCNTCYDRRKCPVCKLWDRYTELVSRDSKKMCRMCADKLDGAELEKHTKFSADELPISGSLVIPSTKQRPFRTISVETEMNGDGGYIARQLYRCGYINRPQVNGYNDHAPTNDDHISFLKYDGSVTGGELITGRINLDETEHAEAFLQVLSRVRALEKTGKASFTEVCGGHIHIDAHNLDYSDAWRYITVYNYLENVIYRLGGAGTGKLRQHRTLVPGHDRPNGGRGYSNQVIKGPFGTQSTFGKSLMQMDRMCGLNFQHFVRSKSNCQCGAYAVENSKDCSCNLGKSTIEWRVWNSTGSPRILHAWVALMQAVTAFADSTTPMTPQEEGKYPVFGWDRRPFTLATHGAATKERLEWIHTQLPLSQAERDSLIFAAKHSELKQLGDEYLEGLAQLANNAPVPEKKGARNPNRRERKILIEPPAPGDVAPLS